MVYIAYAFAWISAAAVAIFGIHETGRCICAWVMLLPAFLKISNGGGTNDNERE